MNGFPPVRYGDETSSSGALLDRERQNRTAYRYGLFMVCLGVLLNWIGFNEHSLMPVRYLGLGCVVAGGLLICVVMCRSMRFKRANRARMRRQRGDGIQVITDGILTGHGDAWGTKPPDYDAVVGDLPPTYDEAMAALDAKAFLKAKGCDGSDARSSVAGGAEGGVVGGPGGGDSVVGGPGGGDSVVGGAEGGGSVAGGAEGGGSVAGGADGNVGGDRDVGGRDAGSRDAETRIRIEDGPCSAL